MSEFDDMMREGLDEALDFLGGTEFQLAGQTYRGDLDELGDQGYTITDGGKELTVTAHLVCPRAQFTTPPRAGQRIKIGTRTLAIVNVSEDAAAYTLLLGDPDR